MTRQHAKTTVDMPSGLFPSTCQTRLSPLTCQKSVRRHAKTMVSADMPRNCVRRHVKTTPRDAKTRRIVSVPVDMPKRRAPMATFYIAGSFYTVGDFLTFRRVVSRPHACFLCSIMFSTMKLSCGLMKKTLIVS